MHFDERLIAGAVVLTVHGDMVLGANGARLADSVRRQVEKGHGRIVLNLRDVRYVDSAGVAELVECLAAVTHRSGVLKLAGVPERLHHLLALTRLAFAFDHVETEADAIGPEMPGVTPASRPRDASRAADDRTERSDASRTRRTGSRA